MSFNPKDGGPHLGRMRSWIQRYAANGETVTWWGSNTPLVFRRAITPRILDDLACEIAAAVYADLITADKLQDAWVQAGRPQLQLLAQDYTVATTAGQAPANCYLDIDAALRGLLFKLLEIANRCGSGK